MPEANVLYSVTGVVVLGLVAWVAVVLKSAKEPWTRDVPPPPREAQDLAPDAPLVKDEPAAPTEPATDDAPKVVAESDAKPATEVVLEERTAEKPSDDAKADDAKSDDAKSDDADAKKA